MQQYSKTEHVLQTRGKLDSTWSSWYAPAAGMFQPAKLLAYHGRLTEAIEKAEEIYMENYGNMHGVEFRCLTVTKTVTVNMGIIDKETL